MRQHKVVLCLVIFILLNLSLQSVAHSIGYRYDRLNRLVQIIHDDGTVEGTLVVRYSYDSAGNVKSIILVPFQYGDVNFDQSIDVGDSIVVLRYITGLITLESHEFRAADVNKDGNVDVSDSILIQRYIVGLISEFPT